MATACVDPDDFEVSEGTGQLKIRRDLLGLRERLVFSTPGATTFEVADYPNLQRVSVRVVGGGGGSAGADADTGELIATAGGAGGGYAEALLDVSEIGVSALVVVGAGGAAGGPNGDGGDGGPSQFGATVTAPGGAGSGTAMSSGTTPATVNGVNGPFAGLGDLSIGGGASGSAMRLSGTVGMAGRGGDSQYGTGGLGRATAGGGFGGKGYGSGGGGVVSTGAAFSGAAGNSGLVVVDLYF